MKPYDVCIAFISWEDGGKRRPVLLVAENGEYTKAYHITAQYANKSDSIKAAYFEIIDLKQAGLVKQSYFDTIRFVEIPTARLSAPIGALSDNDKRRLIGFLNNQV